MILPIGHEESSVRRLPWVSFGIILLCLVSFLMTDMEAVELAPTRQELMEDAVEYWRDHAYLEAVPEIRTKVAYDVMPNQRSQYLALLVDEAVQSSPDEEEVWDAEQAELDRLTAIGLGDASPPQEDTGDSPFHRWGLLAGQIGLVTLVTHIFMHAGWFHLISNMLLFFLAGPPVEDRLGRPLFAAFFVGAGMFGGLFWALLSNDPAIPLVGASGAIAGVLGVFCIRFWSSNIRFAYFFMFGFRPYYGTFEAQSWVMLPLWFLTEIFQAWWAHSMGFSGGVAYTAHIGGFLFGVAATVGLRVSKLEERFIDRSIEAKVTVAATNPVLDEALDARARGEHEQALSILAEAWEADSSDRDVALALWDAAVACERAEVGVPALVAAVRLCAQAGEKELAIRHWMDLNNYDPSALVDAGALMRLVPMLVEEGNQELAVCMLRHVVDPGNTGLSPGLAARVMEIGREVDPPSVLRAAHFMLALPDLHDAKRAKFVDLVAELEAAGVSESPDVVVAASERRRAEQASREIELPDETDPLASADGVLPPLLPVGASLGDEADGFAPAELDMPPPSPPPSPPPLPSAVPSPLPQATLETGAPAPEAEIATPPPLPEDLGAMTMIVPLAVESESLVREAAVQAPPVELEGESTLEPTEDLFGAALGSLGGLPRFSQSKVVEAVPTGLEEDVVRFKVSGNRKAKVEYDKIEAIAVALVKGLGEEPTIVIDLLLNWTELEGATLRVIRFRTSLFDPVALFPESTSPDHALQQMVGAVLERSGAIPLPDVGAVRGEPYAEFERLSAYCRDVLEVASE